jgi:16S rRNA (guanine527-N7)-methyltransferase
MLSRSRELGFLGPGPVDAHIAHASAFAAALERPPTLLLDLGAGGGVPGLVLGALWPEASVVLLDASRRRTRFLEEAVAQLGWTGRVLVRCVRAEVAGRDPEQRSHFDAVVARGFGRPATTAECAAAFLRVDGLLVVSEPPTDETEPGSERWPADGCAVFGLEPVRRVLAPVAVQVLKQVSPCPDRFPRRDGVPGKRPLF